MFQDEAGFGRINKPKYCWYLKGIRPSVPCHHIREYRYIYGAVEPATGASCFLIPPYTPEMNPIEQIWKELQRRGVRNETFTTLEKVVISCLSREVIKNIAARD